MGSADRSTNNRSINKASRRKTAKFVCFSDTHAPFEDWGALNRVIAIIREVQPDYIIHGGDLVEGASASKHPNEYTHDHIDECEHADRILQAVEEACPTARRVLCQGNHDDNVEAENRIPKSARRAMDLKRHCPALERWHVVPYRNDPTVGCFRLGQVVFMHGWGVQANGDRDEAVRFGQYANTLTVRGHTHRPVEPSESCFGTKNWVPFWFANTGTCGPLKPPYAHRLDTSRWGRAVLVGETRIGRLCLPTREWSADLIRLP